VAYKRFSVPMPKAPGAPPAPHVPGAPSEPGMPHAPGAPQLRAIHAKTGGGGSLGRYRSGVKLPKMPKL
jgi:hypothetical protein